MKRIKYERGKIVRDNAVRLLDIIGYKDKLLPIPKQFRKCVNARVMVSLANQYLFDLDNSLFYVDSDLCLRCTSADKRDTLLSSGVHTDAFTDDDCKTRYSKKTRFNKVAGRYVDSLLFDRAMNELASAIVNERLNVGDTVWEYVCCAYNRQVINKYVIITPNSWAGVSGDTERTCDWDNSVFETYVCIIDLLKYWESHKSYLYFTDKYPAFKDCELVHRYLTKVYAPTFNRLGHSSAAKAFDTVEVVVSLTTEDKQKRNEALRKNVQDISKCALTHIANSKSFQKYGVPISILKPDTYTITTDDRLVLLFALKDELVDKSAVS